MPQISFNGRFLAAPQTGVQRVARQLILSLLEALDEQPSLKQKFDFKLICPQNIQHRIDRPDLPHELFGGLRGQLWEQIDLPRADTGDLLINLCNLAPLASRNSVTMIHDAQVFISPASYSRAFRTWYQFAQPRIGKRAKKILTVSHYSAEQLSRFGVATSNKIAVIHNGIDHMQKAELDPTILDRLGLNGRAFSVGLANTQAHKNVRVLLDAYRNLELANHTLILFGAADAAAFADAGMTVPNNVIFAGRVSDGELRSLLETAVALVFPSKTEGFGLPPLEAMTFGTPAICAEAGALPEVCADAAIYVDPDDAAAWAQTIRQISDESDLERQKRQIDSQDRAATFTWRAAGRRLLDVILEETGL